jgi:hypothetical protein
MDVPPCNNGAFTNMLTAPNGRDSALPRAKTISCDSTGPLTCIPRSKPPNRTIENLESTIFKRAALDAAMIWVAMPDPSGSLPYETRTTVRPENDLNSSEMADCCSRLRPLGATTDSSLTRSSRSASDTRCLSKRRCRGARKKKPARFSGSVLVWIYLFMLFLSSKLCLSLRSLWSRLDPDVYRRNCRPPIYVAGHYRVEP